MGQLTLKEFRTSFDLNKENVKQISKDQLNVLWFDDWYDGMLSGILEHEGQKFRFEIITNYTQNIYPRSYAIIQMTEEEFKEELYRGDLFKNHVADYKNRIYKPATEHHLYFDEVSKRKQLDYEPSIIYGWFIDLE
jgi:hypothetical protein